YDKICYFCNSEYIENRTLARWTDNGVELLQDQVGYWGFSDYRYLDPAGEFLGIDEINKHHIEDMNYINQIIEENIFSKQILENSKELFPCS
ncbi:27565_t:CDS:1, partial [Dentiscutata erythropus]